MINLGATEFRAPKNKNKHRHQHQHPFLPPDLAHFYFGGKQGRKGGENEAQLFSQFLQRESRPTTAATHPNAFPGAVVIGKVLPDIKMINKYYGLVPKKFTVHSRTVSDKKIRSKSAFPRKPSNSEEIPAVKSPRVPLPTKSLDLENESLLTRKLSVERQKRKFCPTTSKSWDNSSSQSHARETLSQTTITIHLNHCEKGVEDTDSSDSDGRQSESELDNREQIDGQTLDINNCEKNGNVKEVVVDREKVVTKSSVGESPRGRSSRSLKKTISFDEQLLLHRNQSESAVLVKAPRPMTAVAQGNLNTPPPHPPPHPHNAPPKLQPWTRATTSLAERRGKLQKSVALRQYSMDPCEEQGSSFDSFISNGSTPAAPASGRLPTTSAPSKDSSKKSSFYFQVAPEVATMVSQYSPDENAQVDIQVEIEKVAALLHSIGNITSNSVNGESHDLNGNRIGEAKTITASQQHLQPETLSPSPNPPPPRPILKKAISISCEKDAPAALKNEVNRGGNNSKLQRTLSTSFLQPQKSNSNGWNSKSQSAKKDQSQCQPGRRIALKKGLQEIHQVYMSSLLLKRHAGAAKGRPRTAPVLEHKTKPTRGPLKAKPVRCTGTGKVDGTIKVIPTLAMGKKVSGQGQKTGEPAASTTAKEGSQDKNAGKGKEQGSSGSSSRSTLPRRSFSLDEGLLLSLNEDEVVELEGGSGRGSRSSIQSLFEDEEKSSKKREQCLKIYEKINKTGMSVKLETIFRGMMTPTEYRSFKKAADEAAQVKKDELGEGEEDADGKEVEKVDAGVHSHEEIIL